ncbi:hypothetical protein HS088_TW23G00887 [Tripterygium wilfordii]|uniref:Uncharacterized protein n=1 Tax=Tripterygium wilfordii TaxID=458696 RepID=A0A7J7BX78_TRIWF|nr:hypothetical protein HS088_TW23G00887 [Tripterygium wilfordii]
MACYYVNNPQSSRKKWLGLFVKVAILGIVMVASVNSEDQTGLLCISDCDTCPVICSPPPSPVKSHTPPPPHSSPPPPPLLTPIYQSPPQSDCHSPPPPPPVPSPNIPRINVVPTPPSSSNSPPTSGEMVG